MSTPQSTNYNENYSIDPDFFRSCYNSNFSGYPKEVAMFLMKFRNANSSKQRQITPLTQKRLYESTIENLRREMNLTDRFIDVKIEVEGMDENNENIEIDVNPDNDKVLNLKNIRVKVTIKGLHNQYTGDEEIAQWLEKEISQATSNNNPIEAVIGPWLPGGGKSTLNKRDDYNYKLQQNYTAIKNALEEKKPLTVILIDSKFSEEGFGGQIVDRLKNEGYNFLFKKEGNKSLGKFPYMYPDEFICDNVRIIYVGMFLDDETLEKIGFFENKSTNLTPYIRGCEEKSKLSVINNNQNEISLQGLVNFSYEDNSFISGDDSPDKQQVVEENTMTSQFNNYKAPTPSNEDVDNSNNVNLENNDTSDNLGNNDDKNKTTKKLSD